MPQKPSLYFESRYRKLVRDLPQTIFWCPECKGDRRRRRGCERCQGRGKLTDDSVQELIARRLLPAFRAHSGKFHGAGREDIDVLMLGSGRPFVFEVVGPRIHDVDLEAVRGRLHGEEGHRIRIDPLRPVPRTRVAELKEARLAKRYRLAIACEREVALEEFQALVGRELEVRQRTPQRVAHRRADLIRTRKVTVLDARPGDGDVVCELDVETEHGTYVKEWVSGDAGRSQPALAELLGTATHCARLDVLDIVDAPATPA